MVAASWMFLRQNFQLRSGFGELRPLFGCEQERPGSLGALSPTPLLRSAVNLLAPWLGAARGARACVEAALAGGRSPYATTYERMVDSPLPQCRRADREWRSCSTCTARASR